MPKQRRGRITWYNMLFQVAHKQQTRYRLSFYPYTGGAGHRAPALVHQIYFMCQKCFYRCRCKWLAGRCTRNSTVKTNFPVSSSFCLCLCHFVGRKWFRRDRRRWRWNDDEQYFIIVSFRWAGDHVYCVMDFNTNRVAPAHRARAPAIFLFNFFEHFVTWNFIPSFRCAELNISNICRRATRHLCICEL